MKYANYLSVNFCNEYRSYKIMGLIGYIILFIQISIPIILIVMGTIDLIKALFQFDNDDTNKSYKIIFKRFIYAVIVFFIPIIVKFFMNMVSNNKDTEQCFWAISNPKEAMEKSDIVRGSFNNSSYYNTKESCEKTGRKWILTHSQLVNCNGDGCYICVEEGR